MLARNSVYAGSMCRVLVAVLAVLGGCIHEDLVDCGDGLACPNGTACIQVQGTTDCVAPEDLAACRDRDPFAACTRDDGTTGACYDAQPSRVCLPAGCGNGLSDPGEVCDDRNGIVGDGCSASCTSNETCGNGVVDPVTGEQCDDHNLVGRDGCASECRPEAAQWDLFRIGLPTGGFASALAYDAARHRLVMFGGVLQNGQGIPVPRDETWEWDGVAWTLMSTPIAPSARSDHSLVYDPVRRRVVLFGGATVGALVGTETWEWDGGVWTARPSAVTPPARSAAAATWDPERERVAIFGGRTDTAALGDWWEWDGVTWTEVKGTLPSPRTGAAMIYEPVRGAMVLSGGQGLDETWERRAGVWSKIAAAPPELQYPQLAFDGTGVIAFGGTDAGDSQGNTWRWDGTSWANIVPFAAGSPPRRARAAIARDWSTGEVLLVGGRTEIAQCGSCASTRSDVWAWNGATLQWREIRPSAPSGRAAHAAAFDNLRGAMVMFGGGNALYAVQNPAETWELREGHWTQFFGSGPPARAGAAMAFDAAHGEAVMFGGVTAGNVVFADTWLWNGARWLEQTQGPRPPARQAAMMAYDAGRRRTVLFGGLAPGGEVDTATWEWDGTAWTEHVAAIAPPARYRGAMAFDPRRGRVVLTSGESSLTSYGDSWEWDGATWVMVATSQMLPPRGGSAMAWNAARGSLTVFAGAAQIFGQLEDTWELIGTTWSQVLAPVRPGFRQGHSLVPLGDGTGVLAFGGLLSSGTGSADLWRLRWTSSSTYEQCAGSFDADGDGLTGCADPDCWARCTPMCPPGTTCDASWPRCGDGVCNAALEDCRICPQDCACAPVCGDTFCDPGETCPGDC